MVKQEGPPIKANLGNGIERRGGGGNVKEEVI